jgi:hypothetical protein
MKQRGFTFGQYEYKAKELCIKPGLYNFTIWDEYGTFEVYHFDEIRLLKHPSSCMRI